MDSIIGEEFQKLKGQGFRRFTKVNIEVTKNLNNSPNFYFIPQTLFGEVCSPKFKLYFNRDIEIFRHILSFPRMYKSNVAPVVFHYGSMIPRNQW